MKYLKLFESHKELQSLCYNFQINNYTINNDGSIDVRESVVMSRRRLLECPIKFRNVDGDFDISEAEITTFKNLPITISGTLDITSNKITSFENSPIEIGDAFYGAYNKFESLKGLTPNIGSHVFLNGNPLPYEIINNKRYWPMIIKNQDIYGIWNSDNTLNKYRFEEMMIDLRYESK